MLKVLTLDISTIIKTKDPLETARAIYKGENLDLIRWVDKHKIASEDWLDEANFLEAQHRLDAPGAGLGYLLAIIPNLRKPVNPSTIGVRFRVDSVWRVELKSKVSEYLLANPGSRSCKIAEDLCPESGGAGLSTVKEALREAVADGEAFYINDRRPGGGRFCLYSLTEYGMEQLRKPKPTQTPGISEHWRKIAQESLVAYVEENPLRTAREIAKVLCPGRGESGVVFIKGQLGTLCKNGVLNYHKMPNTLPRGGASFCLYYRVGLSLDQALISRALREAKLSLQSSINKQYRELTAV